MQITFDGVIKLRLIALFEFFNHFVILFDECCKLCVFWVTLKRFKLCAFLNQIGGKAKASRLAYGVNMARISFRADVGDFGIGE